MAITKAEVHEIYEKLRDELKRKFNRTVSFADYFTDRWERARYEGFGEGTSVYDNVLILGDVRVGQHTWIGPNVILDGRGGLVIGDLLQHQRRRTDLHPSYRALVHNTR